MYPIREIYEQQSNILEPLGTKRKFWFNLSGQPHLYKAEDRGTGEDWAEKLVCELAELLGIPHVHYELATDKVRNTPGVICASMLINGEELQLGNEVLAQLVEGYVTANLGRYEMRAHTVDTVSKALQTIDPPDSRWCAKLPDGIGNALDVFVGYILLDTWVANGDRHHENWGVVKKSGTRSRLAPTFDHGAALARNLSDEDREERLTTRDKNYRIPAFARRAQSAFFASESDSKPLSTFDAWRMFTAKSPKAGTIWRGQLENLGEAAIDDLLHKVPSLRMSDVCKEFTRALLMENRGRLLE